MLGIAIASAAALAFVAGSIAHPESAAAADHTFVVNSIGDSASAGSTADGICDTGAPVGGAPECTLRAAIEEANGTAGADAVDATAVSGTIQLGSRLQISSDLEISGPGADALTVSGEGDAGGYQVVYISGGGAVGISGLTIANGTALPSAAGVDAGGIMSYATTLTLDAVVVTGNHLATTAAGAGGIASDGDVVITRSTVSGNTGTGSFTFGQGGGVYIGNSHLLTVTNSTIGGNQVTGGASGGGGIRSTGAVTLDSVTFAENTATTTGIPARDVWAHGVVSTANTIFGSVGATGVPCHSNGGITSLGHNLEVGSDASCSLVQPTDLSGVDPLLGALGANGGTTPTYAPAATSPAVDTGDTPQAADLGGVARPQGIADDIGAFELQLDTTPPDTIIDLGPAAGSTIATAAATFAFHSTEAGSTLACSQDSAPYADCSSGVQNLVALADGPHTFAVRATDGAGNVDPTPATIAFTVDTTAPTTAIVTGPTGPGTDHDPSFSFTSTEAGSTFECRLDGPGAATTGYVACTSPFAYSALTDGTYTFSVRAIDGVGNIDPAPASRTFSISTPAAAGGTPLAVTGSAIEPWVLLSLAGLLIALGIGFALLRRPERSR
jgi:hypothetical protein